jgi:hypothetical protein
MRSILLAAVLLAPISVAAANECKYEAPRNLQLDLAGVRGVQIEVNSQDVHVNGRAGMQGLSVHGRACASDKSLLDGLQVTQHREGDQLIVAAESRNRAFHMFGSSYTSLELDVQLPSTMPLTVEVGSGDADVTGVQQLDSHVGSGDLHVKQVAQAVSVSVGSGDVDISDVGSLSLGSVGSGDARVSKVHGDVRIGSIGSGDVGLRDVGGSVHADTLGSGDLNVHDVGGDLHLGAKGSGDIDYSGIKGRVSVPRDDD